MGVGGRQLPEKIPAQQREETKSCTVGQGRKRRVRLSTRRILLDQVKK